MQRHHISDIRMRTIDGEHLAVIGNKALCNSISRYEMRQKSFIFPAVLRFTYYVLLALRQHDMVM